MCQVLKGLSKTPSFSLGSCRQSWVHTPWHTLPVQHIWVHQTRCSACLGDMQEGCSVRWAWTWAQQSGLGDFWTPESPDEDFALFLPATFLIWTQINFPSPGKLKGMSVQSQSPEKLLKDLFVAFPSTFEKHMKWAKYTPLVLRGGSTPSFPEERLSRLTPPYFHWSSDISAIVWRSQHLDSKSLASGKPQGNPEHCTSFTDQALLGYRLLFKMQ